MEDYIHLHRLAYLSPAGRTVKIDRPEARGEVSSSDVRVGALPLAIGDRLSYAFDFGDWWESMLTVENIDLEIVQPDTVRTIAFHGKAPEQYPDRGDWD